MQNAKHTGAMFAAFSLASALVTVLVIVLLSIATTPLVMDSSLHHQLRGKEASGYQHRRFTL